MVGAIKAFLTELAWRVLTLVALGVIFGCVLVVGVCDGRGDAPGSRYLPHRVQ